MHTYNVFGSLSITIFTIHGLSKQNFWITIVHTNNKQSSEILKSNSHVHYSNKPLQLSNIEQYIHSSSRQVTVHFKWSTQTFENPYFVDGHHQTVFRNNTRQCQRKNFSDPKQSADCRRQQYIYQHFSFLSYWPVLPQKRWDAGGRL